jgi:hypothetical protein
MKGSISKIREIKPDEIPEEANRVAQTFSARLTAALAKQKKQKKVSESGITPDAWRA